MRIIYWRKKFRIYDLWFTGYRVEWSKVLSRLLSCESIIASLWVKWLGLRFSSQVSQCMPIILLSSAYNLLLFMNLSGILLWTIKITFRHALEGYSTCNNFTFGKLSPNTNFSILFERNANIHLSIYQSIHLIS